MKMCFVQRRIVQLNYFYLVYCIKDPQLHLKGMKITAEAKKNEFVYITLIAVTFTANKNK